MSGLKLEAKHIKSREVIGELNQGYGEPISVNLLKTFGGLRIVAIMKNNKPEILGCARDDELAKYNAEMVYPSKITWFSDEKTKK